MSDKQDDFLKAATASFSTIGIGRTLNNRLSSLEDLLATGNSEEALECLQQLKCLIETKLPKMHGTPADISVETEVTMLRAMRAKTTTGTWHCLPGRSLVISGELSAEGYSGHDVLRGHGPLAAEAKANAALSAKLFNASNAFFDAAELVQHVLNEQDKLPRDQRDPFIVDRAQATLSKLKASLA